MFADPFSMLTERLPVIETSKQQLHRPPTTTTRQKPKSWLRKHATLLIVIFLVVAAAVVIPVMYVTVWSKQKDDNGTIQTPDQVEISSNLAEWSSTHTAAATTA
ncbi:hypothetical protein JCM10207_000714 [Rhodosporidiobolus poonsookiae]